MNFDVSLPSDHTTAAVLGFEKIGIAELRARPSGNVCHFPSAFA